MCAQVCADTLRDGAAAEGTPGEAHPQGLFWNLLSKSPTGAVGIGSSPLGEPVQPLDYFSQLPCPSLLKHCSLRLVAYPVGQGFYSEGPATVLKPSLGVQTSCARARRAGLLWAQCPAWTQSFGLSVLIWAGGTAVHTGLQNQHEGQMPRVPALSPHPPQDFDLPEPYTGTGFGCLGPLSSKLN